MSQLVIHKSIDSTTANRVKKAIDSYLAGLQVTSFENFRNEMLAQAVQLTADGPVREAVRDYLNEIAAEILPPTTLTAMQLEVGEVQDDSVAASAGSAAMGAPRGMSTRTKVALGVVAVVLVGAGGVVAFPFVAPVVGGALAAGTSTAVVAGVAAAVAGGFALIAGAVVFGVGAFMGWLISRKNPEAPSNTQQNGQSPARPVVLAEPVVDSDAAVTAHYDVVGEQPLSSGPTVVDEPLVSAVGSTKSMKDASLQLPPTHLAFMPPPVVMRAMDQAEMEDEKVRLATETNKMRPGQGHGQDQES